MANLNVREAFEDVKTFIGGAVKEERESQKIKRETLAGILLQKYVWTKMHKELLEDIENNRYKHLTFGEVGLICLALDCSMGRIIKRAALIRERVKRALLEIPQ